MGYLSLERLALCRKAPWVDCLCLVILFGLKLSDQERGMSWSWGSQGVCGLGAPV